MDIAPGSVWLDARGAHSAAHGKRGIPRYVAEHARALVENAPELIGSVGIDPAGPPPQTLDPLIGSGLLTWHSKTGAGGRPVPSAYHVMSAFEVPIGFDDIWPVWAREGGCRLVVTLYDLIPLIMRDQYLADWGYWATGWMSRLGLVRSAHQVLTISQQTADDAMERLRIPEERITVIDSGVSGLFSSLVGSRAEADSVLRRELPNVRPGFLLYVGGTDFRKNLEGTIRAYGQLPGPQRSAHQLVIACKLDILRRSELKAFARRMGIAPGDMVLTGFVPDPVLASLYRSCELFVFPSLYEGAGLPILEAMSCGAPVVSSNTSAMPELLGDLEGTFDPADPADMARCIREVLEHPDRLQSLRERSRKRVEIHTWDRVAKRTIEGYERALQVPLEGRTVHADRAQSRKRKRVALITPWPPQASGAALHSRRLAEQLVEHAEIDVIVPAAAEVGTDFDRSLDGEVQIRTDAQFEWLHNLRSYDRCLYVLGGSQFHLHALEMIMRVPGVVLAHDVRLLDLYLELQRHRFVYDPRWLEGKLVEMYGDRIELSQLRRIPYGDSSTREGVTMTREIQAQAQQLLVHSRYQAELLRLERPRDAGPTEVVPPGIPPATPQPDGHRNGDGQLVVATGSDSNWPKLIEGFAELSGSRDSVRLTILGEIEGKTRTSIEEMAGRLGVGGSVEAPGRLDQDSYWRVLHGAALGLQLSEDAEGGRVSTTVCDLVAARVPTIVTEVGWRKELPYPVALGVATDCSSTALARQMASVLADDGLRDEIRGAQDRYATENSFAGVAERIAELLAL